MGLFAATLMLLPLRTFTPPVASAARACWSPSRHVTYSFLFMKASGDQLREITALVETGAIRPIVDRVFPFESTNEALAYVGSGRAKGKVVVTMSSHRE